MDEVAFRALAPLVLLLAVSCGSPEVGGGIGDAVATGGDAAATGGDAGATGGDAAATGGDAAATGGDASETPSHLLADKDSGHDAADILDVRGRCPPGTQRSCYEDDPQTEQVGTCRAGTQTCNATGTAWGSCKGQQLPVAEVCGNGEDDNCDGVDDDGCACTARAQRACYSGAPATRNVGLCRAGTQTCNARGTAWGSCKGQQLPVAEVCGNGEDDNCDGVDDDGCACTARAQRACYSGAPATRNVGLCRAGTQTCNATGTAWGSCAAQRLPVAEVCDSGADEDCDGAEQSCSLCPAGQSHCAADGCAAAAGTDQPSYFGLRYWSPRFPRMVFNFRAGANKYVSATVRDGQLEYWTIVLTTSGKRQLQVRRGPSIDRLGAIQVALDDLRPLLFDVTPLLPAGPIDKRTMTRLSMYYFPGTGYVGLGSVAPIYDPPDKRMNLEPALIYSPTGNAGTWKYLGKLSGDPAVETAARRVWVDGGSIVKLANGRWRIYTNGYDGVTMLESSDLDGPWRFVTAGSKRVNVLRGVTNFRFFPHVLKVSEDEWHMWVSDVWPVQQIRHLSSYDGRNWTLYGRQPEITRYGIANRSSDYRALRAVVVPSGDSIIGLLNGHWSRMPLGVRNCLY